MRQLNRLKGVIGILLFIILFMTPTLKAETFPQRHSIRVGVLSFDETNKGVYRWQPTIDYLNQRFPQYQFILITGDIKSIDQLVASGTIDFAITNGVKFLQYQHDYDAVRMLSLNPLYGEPRYAIGSTVIARRDTPVMSRWEEIKDKNIIATTPQAFGGFQIAKREWLNEGLDPTRDFLICALSGCRRKTYYSSWRQGKRTLRSCRRAFWNSPLRLGDLMPTSLTW